MRAMPVLMVCALGIHTQATAQNCPGPVPDSLAYVGQDSTTMPPSSFRRAVVGAMQERGYRIASDSDSLVVRTEPRFEWPDRPFFDPLRTRPHPGATVTVTLRPQRGATYWDLVARAVCLVPTDHPQPGQPPVERAAPAAAGFDIEWALTQRLPRRPVSAPPSREIRARMINCPRPQVPPGAHGRVVVDAVIDTAGRIDPTSVRVTTPFRPDLDSAAVTAVKACRFEPGRDAAGAPIWVRVQVPIDFAP